MSYITLSNEIDTVYSKLLTENKRSIAVISATSGEGVTSMVLALARRTTVWAKRISGGF